MNAYRDRTSLSVVELCRWTGLKRSTYYYRPKDGKPGAKASTYTMGRDGELVSNNWIVEEIRAILKGEFADYGYAITTEILRRAYVINRKKVYRLMDENKLLLDKPFKSCTPRTFIKLRCIEASRPMEHLSMDIKYVWVAGEKRNYYLLSIIDVYSKRLLQSMLKRSIRKSDVVDLLKKLNDRNAIKGVTIRNDNGPQFIAHQVRNFIRLAEVSQEFSHPATPEDNSYIEAFHSILERAVIQRFEFASFYEARTTIDRFIDVYNSYRPHRSVGMLTPNQKWDQGMALISDRQNLERLDSGVSRPGCKGLCQEPAPYSLDSPESNAYLGLSDNSDKQALLQNLLDKNVQFIRG
jgi:transposase InsO family protein